MQYKKQGKVPVPVAACALHVSCSANEAGLGVRCMSWSPGGDVLAVGGYDQVRRIWLGVTCLGNQSNVQFLRLL
jgi:WD40 repeat protein